MVCLSTHKSLKSIEKSKNKINLQNNRILTNPSLKYFLLPDVFLFFLGQPNTLASRQKQTGFETDFQKPSPEVAKDLAQLDEARVKLFLFPDTRSSPGTKESQQGSRDPAGF